MRINNVITKMQAGEKAYGCSLTFPSTAVVELMGQAGLDHVSFDSEHGPFTQDSIDDLCRVADMAGLTPMARVPNIDPSTILRFLDRGIMGITGPHITTGTGPTASRFLPVRPKGQAQLRFGKGRIPWGLSFGSGVYGAYQLADSGDGPAGGH